MTFVPQFTTTKMASFVRISLLVLFFSLGLYFADKFFAGGICHSKARLDGKTVIITGGNTGIGKETAIDLASRGAKVIIGCRSKERGEKALIDIKKESGSKEVYLKLLDLSSFKSVRRFANSILESEGRLDILINNAGVLMPPFRETEDGFESHFQVNHLGHFLLTQMLIDLLKKSAPSRIINVSSLSHFSATVSDFDSIDKKENYSAYSAYCVSKLANVVYTRELSRRYSMDKVTSYSLHPGAVSTDALRNLFKQYPILETLISFTKPLLMLFMKNSKEGAQTTICCAVEEGLEQFSGEYFSDCAVVAPSADAKNESFARTLWDLSVQATKVEIN